MYVIVINCNKCHGRSGQCTVGMDNGGTEPFLGVREHFREWLDYRHKNKTLYRGEKI